MRSHRIPPIATNEKGRAVGALTRTRKIRRLNFANVACGSSQDVRGHHSKEGCRPASGEPPPLLSGLWEALGVVARQ